MALDPKYFVTSDLRGFFIDKDTGTPLANGILTFYRDSARTVLKPIYQLTGSAGSPVYTQLPNPLTLNQVGVPQNASGDSVVVYYYPWIDDGMGNLVLDLYYVRATDSNFNEEWTQPAWPNLTAGGSTFPDEASRGNQLSNPTFTNILFNDGTTNTYTATGSNQVFALAPNWDLVLSGSGDVVVQRIATTGNEKVPSSPPYVLDVSVNGGVSNCYLRQRFNVNSGLWSSGLLYDLFLNASFVARNEGGGNVQLDLFYQESNGNPAVTLLSSSVSGGAYLFYTDTGVQIPASTNTDAADGYIDIYLSIPSGAHVRVSALQVIPSVTEAIESSPLDLNSSNRDEAFQGDYYIPRLNAKPVDSFLTGWDFSLNPFQVFTNPAPTELQTNPAYIVDQTIGAKVGGGAVTFSRNSVSGGLDLGSVLANQFYIMQYLSGAQVKNMLGKRLSVNVFGYCNASGTSTTMRVYLYRGSSGATFPILPTSIGTLSSSGIFSLTAANWSEIPRSGLPTAQVILKSIATNDGIYNANNNYGFSGWQLTDATQIGDTDKFAIVVTFVSTGSGRITTLNSISVVPGDIPCAPSPKTYDETLRECQYYYSKSFPIATPPTNNPGSLVGAYSGIQNVGAASSGFAGQFSFPVKMRVVPTVVLYNPTTGTANQIRNSSTSADWTGSFAGVSDPTFFVANGTTPGGSAVGNVATFFWSADARLGVV